MKTIKNMLNSAVKRVSDDIASMMVKEGWNYCPKSEWRDFKGTTKSLAIKGDKISKEDVSEKNLTNKEVNKREQKRTRWKKNKRQTEKM